MASETRLEIHAHHIPNCENDDIEYDEKIEKLCNLIAENKKNETDRTIVLLETDKNIALISSELRYRDYPDSVFWGRALQEPCSVIESSLEQFNSGSTCYATCNMNVFLMTDFELAENYIFYDLPTRNSLLVKLLNMIEKKANARQQTVRLDFLTSKRDKVNSLTALALQMRDRKIARPEWLSGSAMTAAKKKEQEEAEMLAARPVKRVRIPSPTVYDIERGPDGTYFVPSKFLRVTSMNDDENESEDDDVVEFEDPNYNSEDEFLPPWFLN